MNNNIISRKLTLLLIKYIPVIQMTGIFINRLLDYFTNLEIVDILDFIFGSTILATILLISCSRTFRRWLATMIGNGMPIDWDELL